jgi:DNA-binding transcriptional ArsR family regulator
VLRNEGLVQTRRDGKWIYYRLESEKVQAILQTLYQIYCGGEHP